MVIFHLTDRVVNCKYINAQMISQSVLAYFRSLPSPKLQLYTTILQWQTCFVRNIVASGYIDTEHINCSQTMYFCQNMQSCSIMSSLCDYSVRALWLCLGMHITWLRLKKDCSPVKQKMSLHTPHCLFQKYVTVEYNHPPLTFPTKT